MAKCSLSKHVAARSIELFKILKFHKETYVIFTHGTSRYKRHYQALATEQHDHPWQ